MKGRRPIPSAIADIKGNPSKRKRDGEPQGPAPSLRCPKELEGTARAKWKAWSKLLAGMGVLTAADEDALALLCDAWRELIDYRQKVKEGGAVLVSLRQDAEGNDVPGGLYRSPYVDLANRAWEKVLKLLVEFGMTPSARARLKVLPPEASDPFEILLSGAPAPN